MWSKVYKVVICCVILLGSSLSLFVNSKVSAIGADTVVKAVGGKMVVRGLAEKAGMALSPKQLDNVVTVLEKKTFDGDTKAIDFMTKANQVIDMPSSTPATKQGFKKYVVDPLLWVSGLDLIFDVVDGFKDGYDNQTPVIEKMCYPSNTYGADVVSPEQTWVYYEYGVNQRFYKFSGELVRNPEGTYYMIPSNYYWYYSKKNTDTNWTLAASGTANNTYLINPISQMSNVKISNVGTDCSVPPTAEDVIDVSNVDNSTKQNFDNDTYNTNTVYNIELELPDSPDYNDTTKWNEPDIINIENEIDLDDLDNDGIGGLPVPDTDDDDGKGDSIDVLVRVDDEIPIHEKFFLEMADMGQKVEDMYNGVTHFFEVATDGFSSLTTGMSGFTAFLDDFFDWLPSEYRALLGAGFTLGVVSFFLRR